MKRKEFRYAIQFGKYCLNRNPALIFGSGASMSLELPSMNDLVAEIHSKIKFKNLSEVDKIEWKQFLLRFALTDNFEKSLKSIQPSIDLSNEIRAITWKYINPRDRDALRAIENGEKEMPHPELFKYLYHENGEPISAITTNYDRLLEYAAILCRFDYSKIFKREDRVLLEQISNVTAIRDVDDFEIKILKVHGCLDWFYNKLDNLEVKESKKKIPLGLRPCIVGPGTRRQTVSSTEPFKTVIEEVKSVFKTSRAFVTIGYGFRDKHIHRSLVRRWKKRIPLMVFTKECTRELDKLISKNIDQLFLILEEDEQGTLIRTNLYPEGRLLKGFNLWNFSEFMKII